MPTLGHSKNYSSTQPRNMAYGNATIDFKIIKPGFLVLMLLQFLGSLSLYAQMDSSHTGSMVIHSDYRLQILARKEAELNGIVAKSMARSAIGYRLQVLSTNDKELAFKTRSQLLQRYPEQKVYMYFLAPYVKLEFGNFRSKQEADLYKKQISQMLGGASIYYLNKRIEIKPEREIKDEETK